MQPSLDDSGRGASSGDDDFAGVCRRLCVAMAGCRTKRKAASTAFLVAATRR